MKRVINVLTCVFVLSLAFTASVQATPIVLDDYSTDQSSEYVGYSWAGYSPAIFARVGEKLVNLKGVDPTKCAGFYWNGGEKLSPGDSVYAELQADSLNDFGGNAFHGLALSTSLSSSDPYRFYAGESSGWKCLTDGGGEAGEFHDLTWASIPTWAAPFGLTLSRGTGANQDVITWTFSKVGDYGLVGTGTRVLSGLTAEQGLYFGTAHTRSYLVSQPSWDNLTYTAVPEPGTLCLAALGLIGLLAYAWRKRK